MKVRFYYEPSTSEVHMHVWEDCGVTAKCKLDAVDIDENGRIILESEVIEAPAVKTRPFLIFSAEMFEAIVDGIKDGGFGAGSERELEAELKAAKEHLEDMRKIVFCLPERKDEKTDKY